jgi:GAF domain-containing protein
MRHFVVRVKSRFSLSRLGSDDLASMIRLHELSTRLTAKADLMSTLQEVLDAAIELLHADFGNT